MTSASVRMQFAWRSRSTDLSTIVFILRSGIVSAPRWWTADTRFANAVAATEHDGAVVTLTDWVRGVPE